MEEKNQKQESANFKLCFYMQQQVLGFTLVAAIFYSLVSKAQKLTLLYTNNRVYVYFVITKNILGSGFQLYVIHLYKFSVYTKEAKTKRVSNP